jgi:hypothetical protein
MCGGVGVTDKLSKAKIISGSEKQLIPPLCKT